MLLAGDLHQDHAEVLRLGRGQGQVLEAVGPRRIHRHLHAVEVVPLDGLGHHRAVGVAGHADEPGRLLAPQLVEGLQDAVGRLDLRQVGLVAEAVDVEQVHVVGLQPLQARLDLLERRVSRAGATRDLRGEEDLLPTRLHDHADPRLALAVAVVDGGVEVGDAHVDRAVERGEAGLLGLVHQEAAAAAEGEDRHRDARATQHAVGQLRVRGRRHRERGQRRDGAEGQAALAQEIAAGKRFLLCHGTSFRP